MSEGNAKFHAAMEYLDQGYSVIPINPETKKPLIKWLVFQETHPTPEQVEEWFELWPGADIAIVTGAISGIVVVDCDNEAALKSALNYGMRSPVTVQTKRGFHLWFKHPMDGVRRGPRAGGNSRGVDWPKVNGLDFRGDGSYAILPPSNGYVWKIAEGIDPEDDMPTYRDWTPTGTVDDDTFVFANLDLSHVNFDPEKLMTEWERTEQYIRQHYPEKGRIPSGQSNARNDRVLRYAGEMVVQGHFGAELRRRCRIFMDHFYVDHLPDTEFETTVRSVEEMEKRNHPERFDENGQYIYKRPEVAVVDGEIKARKLITSDDAQDLVDAGKNQQYWVEPWLPPQTIVQVHGYSGSGKTMFLQNVLYAMTAGEANFGPYEIHGRAKVLYLDYELSRTDLGRRIMDLRDLYGDAKEKFSVWTPWLENEDMNLRTAKGLMDLQGWIEYAKPDVVVIDTIRTAWSGLSENSAEDWAQVNRLATKLRNAGMSVILLHHSNKPGEDGLGREAGSTNQLTVLETQIRIAQVYRDEETAKSQAGVWAESTIYPRNPFEEFEKQLGPDWYVDMVLEARYGKVRSWGPTHDRYSFIGWATNLNDGSRRMVSSRSTKQRAVAMFAAGHAPADIAQKVMRPLSVIKEWLGLN